MKPVEPALRSVHRDTLSLSRAADRMAGWRYDLSTGRPREGAPVMIKRLLQRICSNLLAKTCAAACAGLLVCALPDSPLQAQTPTPPQARPGEAAVLSLGGRLYDNHWAVLGRQPPPERHPQFPTEVEIAPEATWRCVACHGWDYRGAEGHLGTRSASPILKSLADVRGMDPREIVARISAPPHREMATPIPGDLLLLLARFLSAGQHDMGALMNAEGKATGDPMRGKDIYEGTCIRCHQADGKAPLYGEAGDKSSLGWIARNRPAQAVHKIRNGAPLADMLSLRFIDTDSLAGLLAYLQRLDPPR